MKGKIAPMAAMISATLPVLLILVGNVAAAPAAAGASSSSAPYLAGLATFSPAVRYKA